MIATEKELVEAVNVYGAQHGRLSAHELERDITPCMSPDLLIAFNHASRIDRWRSMLRSPKKYGLNVFISIGEDEYAHQNVLTFDEWYELAVQTASAGRRAVRKLRRIAEVCERLTGQRIDVASLIRSMTA